MSIQACPKCSKHSFDIMCDDGEDHKTTYHCFSCGYRAEESEEYILPCPSCSYRSSSLILCDTDGRHRWCYRCGQFTDVP